MAIENQQLLKYAVYESKDQFFIVTEVLQEVICYVNAPLEVHKSHILEI